MKKAPFLLQAFAARVLATQQEATVSRAELARQGYDVDTLVDMIEAYASLPDEDRGYVVRATETEIHIHRKGAAAPPAAPPVPLAPPAPPAKSEAKGIAHKGPGLGALVNFSAKNSGARPPHRTRH